MSFSGAGPSLRRSWEGRVFNHADTARRRTLVQHRFAFETGWEERQVSGTAIFDSVRPRRPKMKFNHRVHPRVILSMTLTLFGPLTDTTTCLARKGSPTFCSP
jgi:hypothetical protein